MELPKDNMMLLSIINTKLRDFYGNLEELCDDYNLEKSQIESRLQAIGYSYDKNLNKFI